MSIDHVIHHVHNMHIEFPVRIPEDLHSLPVVRFLNVIMNSSTSGKVSSDVMLGGDRADSNSIYGDFSLVHICGGQYYRHYFID